MRACEADRAEPVVLKAAAATGFTNPAHTNLSSQQLADCGAPANQLVQSTSKVCKEDVWPGPMAQRLNKRLLKDSKLLA